MSRDAQLTPMMAQYRRIKGELPPDALLLFRLGDFYEMFFEDAQAGAQLLNVTLTRRAGVPMCGIPHHAASGYISRLLKAGRKVALCDQLEDARPGRLVKREVTQILSPGTHFDERLLVAERNNYLAAVCAVGEALGLALIDLTTGDFKTTELPGEAALLTEMDRQRPAEVILPGESSSLRTLLQGRGNPLTPYEDWVFTPETARFTVRDHFKVASLDGFGLRDRPAAIGAAGAALHYLTQHLRRDVTHLTRLSFYQASDALVLDATTLRNLEVLEPLHADAPKPGSLYAAVNRTVTPMGARLLRDWLSQPLATVEPIRRRQHTVQQWLDQAAALDTFRAQLAEVRDLERTTSRLSVGTGNARDLLALRAALDQLPGIRQVLATVAQSPGTPTDARREGELLPPSAASPPPDSGPAPPRTGEPPGLCVPASQLAELASQLRPLPELTARIACAIVDEPPLAVKEGGMIRDGFDTTLDELRAAARGGKDWIARFQQQEIASTGIPSLKVRYNSVFGYYLEVTKANLDKVPPHYLRKQTIANGERFITPELKEMEGRILGAEERGMKLEYEIFVRVREEVVGHLAEIQQTASALAQLDVLAGFGAAARLGNYCQPEIGDEGRLEIRDGRHPVLDQALSEERFVPNDTALAGRRGRGVGPDHLPGDADDLTPATPQLESAAEIPAASDLRDPGSALRSPRPEAAQVALITGPNMAGKSTYIRQVALLTLLAHTGSFIPAAAARIDLVDRIFTRIGASDDLARGQSTFMVEMSETANILNNAGPRSLVILDEIGRGTSTFDGLSLAWSIVEHLHNQVGAKTLFATHYHELTELAARLPRLRNFNVAVREWRDRVVFLRKILPGGTDKSYGIQVARLAGVPKGVLERAKVILGNLEDSELTPEGTVRQPARHRDRDKLRKLAANPQMDLFG